MRHREALELVQDHTASDRAGRSLHLPPSLSLTRVHPFLPFQKGPACIPGVTCTLLGPVSHLETPPPGQTGCPEIPGTLYWTQSIRSWCGRRRLQSPARFLPSLQGREGEPAQDTSDLMRFGNKQTLWAGGGGEVCIIIVI